MVPKSQKIKIIKKPSKLLENCQPPPTINKQTWISAKLPTHDPNSKPAMFGL